jgi:hypothetical protein
MNGVFWNANIGFVVDRHHMPSQFPDAKKIEQPDFADLLQASGKLPSLGPAPVASWVLARLFHLTNEGLGFGTHDRCYNDGGGYYLNFIAFTRAMKPTAFFYLHGTSNRIRLWGTCAGDASADTILASIADALTENPMELIACKLTTVDTDPPDLHKRRFGKPHVYGWDGNKFLGFRTTT